MISISMTIRPQTLSSRPSVLKIRKIGTSTPTAGIILVESIHIIRSRVLGVGANAMAQAAGTAISRARSVEPIEMGAGGGGGRGGAGRRGAAGERARRQ